MKRTVLKCTATVEVNGETVADVNVAVKQFTIESGTRQIVVTCQDGRWSARLYVNGGETACLENWKGKTEAGARRWAKRILGDG